ncbi:hypothetical protein ABTM34_20985, partial [Acinetobacter baumannii]
LATTADPFDAPDVAEALNVVHEWQAVKPQQEPAEDENAIVVLSYGEDIAERDGILALPEQVFGAYLDIRQQCRTAPSWSVP